MTDSDLTVSILREIRDEIRGTNTRLDTMDTRLVALEGHASVTNQRLETIENHAVVTNERLGVIEHTLVDLSGQVLILSRHARNTTSRHDDAIADLDTRVKKLEKKRG